MDSRRHLQTAKAGRRTRDAQHQAAMDCAAKGTGAPCFPGPATRRCGICGAVAYCSREHQILHWPVHKEECARLEEQMKCADILNDFPFTFLKDDINQESRCCFFISKCLHRIGLWKSECSCGSTVNFLNNSRLTDDWNLPTLDCPCSEPKTPLSFCLSCWKEYYQWRHLSFDSPVAMLLHWPLTVYHGFHLLAAQGLFSELRDELHIHYLGPERELLQLAVFGELQALFPGVQIHMELVGPAVPQLRDGETISLCKYLKCSEANCDCKSTCTGSDIKGSNGRTKRVILKLRKGFYHDKYDSIIKESYPQLIIAPNAGVAAYSSWIPTIELIKEMGIPAMFTDFCEEAANLAASCITAVTGIPLRIPIQINPFRQPMVVENSALYLPCYSNCFLFGM